MKKFNLILLLSIMLLTLVYTNSYAVQNNNWFYPDWAACAKYNEPIQVLDTDSGLGRYSTKTKEITLEDLAKIHGHLCDGLVISYIEIKEAAKKLFLNGVIDRTDLRIVSKNGPCWVDAASMMTGARINFGTLSIDKSVGDGFIIQKISTGEAYSTHLKAGVFPKEQADLEAKIRKLKAEGKPVNPEDIDKVEEMASNLSKKLLNSPPNEILDIQPMPDYKFAFKFSVVKRGDVINKNAPR
jgi:formylmethanofuran dehydrogenase subunit E